MFPKKKPAVANSAGPDSTCLLFLLRRMIDDWNPRTTTTTTDRDGDLSEAAATSVVTDHLPNSIVSLHVDHDLQADAEKMAHAARTSAHTYKTSQHVALRVPWDVPPFPTRPCAHSGDAIESVARTARYRLMFDAMVRERVYVLATGHHADDQVETVLMRLGSGSSILGLGGMRPLRRVGMALGKVENDFGWFGHEGLNRWIVRPLLDVPKVCWCYRIFIFILEGEGLTTRCFRTGSLRLASCMIFTMCLIKQTSSLNSRYAMLSVMCSPATKRNVPLQSPSVRRASFVNQI